ncbi:MAG: hypothetical protein ABIH76_02955 [Candidatus Bathyarchaeota archaeon]
MGGAKKRGLAQAEKAQKVKEKDIDSKKKAKATAGKKVTSPSGSSKQEDKDLVPEIVKLKAITPSAVSSQCGIKVSAAKEFLRELLNKGVIDRVNDSGRLKIYKMAASAS